MIEIEEQEEVDQFLIEMDKVDNNYDEAAYRDKNYDNEDFLTELEPTNPYEAVSYLTNQSTLYLITGQDIFKGHNVIVMSLRRTGCWPLKMSLIYTGGEPMVRTDIE
ncbi:hypothetical protein K3495_g12157 [Podosphaera aphanis]|nr:hypothetical protein K3495_g12157 [Podosphaera aphanis]